jgi:hypothetical protein
MHVSSVITYIADLCEKFHIAPSTSVRALRRCCTACVCGSSVSVPIAERVQQKVEVLELCPLPFPHILLSIPPLLSLVFFLVKVSLYLYSVLCSSRSYADVVARHCFTTAEKCSAERILFVWFLPRVKVYVYRSVCICQAPLQGAYPVITLSRPYGYN